MIGLEYAKSLYEVHPNTKTCLDEFKAFMNFYNELSPVMKSPSISNLDKHNIIKNSLKNYTDEFIYFLYVIIDNDRFSNLNEIYSEFVKIYNRENNIALCDCYTNKKISDKEKKEIIKFLEKEFNKSIELNEVVDSNYLGIKLVCENKTIDYTIESRINNMRLSI